MNTKKLLFYMLAVILGGCVPVLSLHPLYTDNDVVVDKKLCGTWTDDPNSPKTIWEFKIIDDPKNTYKLIFTDEDGKKGSFVTRLVKLQDKLFMDVYPDALPSDANESSELAWPHNAFFLIPAHFFLKIDSIEPQLKLRLILESNLEELLKENPGAVEHTYVNDRLVLTETTKKLQAFIVKYADDERVFTDQLTLSRK
ncbi:MAG: hypothetical protein ACYSTT_11575 [Planctomycetota bacterium]|jgi:hypothetical protein